MPREPEVRISPFALPSDTELRFGLLVWAVLATALLLDHVAYSALHGPAYARAVAAAIAAYCDRLHIGQCPRLFVRNSRIPSAVAFCYDRRAALILNLGLLLQFRMNPASFRATARK